MNPFYSTISTALGFFHMQNTHNRDKYVKINYENIQNGKKNNFKRYDSETVSDFGQEYDYESVMHYNGKAYSKNGEPTIEPYVSCG